MKTPITRQEATDKVYLFLGWTRVYGTWDVPHSNPVTGERWFDTENKYQWHRASPFNDSDLALRIRKKLVSLGWKVTVTNEKEMTTIDLYNEDKVIYISTVSSNELKALVESVLISEDNQFYEIIEPEDGTNEFYQHYSL